MPSAADLLSDVDGIHESTSSAYLPKDLAHLADYWIAVIELSKLLGAVITMNYQTLRAKPSVYQIEALEAELLQYNLPGHYEHDPTRLATFYSYHLQLQYQLRLLGRIKPSPVLISL
jgi:hypothetical protein